MIPIADKVAQYVRLPDPGTLGHKAHVTKSNARRPPLFSDGATQGNVHKGCRERPSCPEERQQIRLGCKVSCCRNGHMHALFVRTRTTNTSINTLSGSRRPTRCGRDQKADDGDQERTPHVFQTSRHPVRLVPGMAQ